MDARSERALQATPLQRSKEDGPLLAPIPAKRTSKLGGIIKLGSAIKRGN